MTLSRSIRFASERFDYASELPADYNAGNRFYGEDVGAFLIDKLAMRGPPANFIDEDWSWAGEPPAPTRATPLPSAPTRCTHR